MLLSRLGALGYDVTEGSSLAGNRYQDRRRKVGSADQPGQPSTKRQESDNGEDEDPEQVVELVRLLDDWCKKGSPGSRTGHLMSLEKVIVGLASGSCSIADN